MENINNDHVCYGFDNIEVLSNSINKYWENHGYYNMKVRPVPTGEKMFKATRLKKYIDKKIEKKDMTIAKLRIIYNRELRIRENN